MEEVGECGLGSNPLYTFEGASLCRLGELQCERQQKKGPTQNIKAWRHTSGGLN